MIQRINDTSEKTRIARNILERLPEWFGIPEARENYIKDSADQIFLAAVTADETIGFLCLKKTGQDTLKLYVMGVLKEYHRKHYGTALIDAAKEIGRKEGFSFLQVKTVQMGRYAEYDATNRFYIHCGFKEFEVIPELWGEQNPCQIYVMSLL